MEDEPFGENPLKRKRKEKEADDAGEKAGRFMF
jgi:hypothetical protein